MRVSKLAAMPKDNNHEEDELDPLDQEDLNEEEAGTEDEGEEIEKEDQSSAVSHQPSDQEEPEDGQEDQVIESSDEAPSDLSSEATEGYNLEQDDAQEAEEDGQAEPEPEPLKSNEWKSMRSSFSPKAPQPSNEHTLDDLAEEDDLPSGVEPSRPKSFAMNMEEDNFKTNIPHMNPNLGNPNMYSNRRTSSSRRKLNTFLLFIIAVLVIGGSVYLLKSKFLTSKGETSYNNPVASSTPEPTPIPTPVFDRSVFKVRVLNGTTKTGLAASISAKLKDLGYQTEKTANATNSAFLTTVVRVKDSDASLSAQLIQDLAPDFNATTSTALKSTDTVDAEVILGKQ